MTDFSLEIQIDPTGLQTISAADMSVAILQPQDQANYQIVALLTSATGTMNITWTDAVSVYTSSYSLEAYSILKINSFASALSEQSFTFDGTLIDQTGTNSLPNTVQLTNTSASTVTSGLAKNFNINSQPQDLAITTASSVLNGGMGSFQISNQIMLTLLGGAQLGMAIPSQAIPNFESQSRSTLISQITAQPPLLLDFTAENPSQTATFNDQTNTFIAG
ncbi:MAG: hypothetical protein ABJO27_03265 [Pseudoruegeria sp.]